MRLPDLFVNRFREIYPDLTIDDCFACMQANSSLFFRLNTLMPEWQQVLSQLSEMGIDAEAHPLYPLMLHTSSVHRQSLVNSDLVLDGRIYIQNPSSLLPVLCLEPCAGEEILDLCAAPGGKTTFIAERMQNQGRIAAVEAVKSRFFKMKKILAQWNASCVHTYLADGRTIGRKVPQRFDRTLLDAPCSSETKLITDQPESWRYWSEKKIKASASKQKPLLRSAFEATKIGGRLVYCTCTTAPEENEGVVNWLLQQYAGSVEVLPLPKLVSDWRPGLADWRGENFHPSLESSRRVLPRHGYACFYLCLLQRTA